MENLFNKYEVYNKKGSKIYDEFSKIVEPFILEKCQTNSINDLKLILLDVIDRIITYEKSKKCINMRIEEKSLIK